MPPNEVAAPFQRPDSAETKTIDKAAVCWNLFSRSIASVAQLAEQLTLNQLVLGSSPSRGTTRPTNAPSQRRPHDSQLGNDCAEHRRGIGIKRRVEVADCC